MDLDTKIKIMAEGGHLLALVRQELAKMAQPGIALIEIDRVAEEKIRQSGGEPAFQKVKGYRWSTCINVNSGVVHGIPDGYKLQSGDTVAIDVGMYYQGFTTDTSLTVPVGKISTQKLAFLETGRQALAAAIAATRASNRVWHISQAMQQVIEAAGYHPVRGLTGHGVGEKLHQAPSIPCFTMGEVESSPKLQVGQTLAIEAIYTLGQPKLITEADGWTISTADGKMAGLFEETVAVTPDGPLILTK